MQKESLCTILCGFSTPGKERRKGGGEEKEGKKDDHDDLHSKTDSAARDDCSIQPRALTDRLLETWAGAA